MSMFHSREKPSSSRQYLIQFPRLPITLPPFVPSLLSFRWTDDDDCEPLSKKASFNPPPLPHRSHLRRRIPKRYSDLVGPTSSKVFLARKDSTNREKSSHHTRSSTHLLRRHSLKPINETIHYFNSSKMKSRERKEFHPHDLLAQRMQAAMSSELMHSLDRNYVSGDRKQLINQLFKPRSHSFNICTSWNRKCQRNTSRYQLIPRAKIPLQKENLRREEPTPDYDEEKEEIIIRTIENDNDINEEPAVDYDDPKPEILGESDEKTMTHTELGVSSSFIVPPTLTDNNEIPISIPPIPPPLPDLYSESQKKTVRCRTIADHISSDHKLILKDEKELNHQPSEPRYIHVSKDLILRKISQTISRSHSISCSLSRINEREIELSIKSPRPTNLNEPIQDCLSSSSPGTSIVLENESEHRSSSSKIYQDYKKRTSLSSVPTIITRNHSMILHPMHTRIGLRSSTSSSSTNEKLTDMTLSSKQMNVCVINQLNEHLSTRFPKQKEEETPLKNNIPEQQSYDRTTDLMSNKQQSHGHVYDEPTDLPVIQQICSSSIPPPPPPLPVGGFRPIVSSANRSSHSQRNSLMALSRETNHSDLLPCSTGTSTISSNLSDTRILRELRENPLFTRAKEHLEVEPGSNGRRSGRRLNGSTINSDRVPNETVSYLRLDTCSKSTLKNSHESSIPKQLETLIMLPNELDAIIGKRTKSINEINQVKTRSCTKTSLSKQYRQSELELIFQKRAQRSEQNLT